MEQNGNQELPPNGLCRMGCGFYGNSQFDGMCSQCYKDNIKRKQQTPSPATVSTGCHSTAVSSIESSSAPLPAALPSIETASPTIPPLTTTENKDNTDSTIEGGAEAKPITSSEEKEDDSKSPKKSKNRCHTCKKKVGLTGFPCRCGGLYCSLHRYSDKHSCSFDYKEHGAELIRKHNPVVVADKVAKI